jgi:hypothetical protein
MFALLSPLDVREGFGSRCQSSPKYMYYTLESSKFIEIFVTLYAGQVAVCTRYFRAKNDPVSSLSLCRLCMPLHCCIPFHTLCPIKRKMQMLHVAHIPRGLRSRRSWAFFFCFHARQSDTQSGVQKEKERRER